MKSGDDLTSQSKNIQLGSMVLVDYRDSDQGASWKTVGWLIDTPNHVIVVHEIVESVDLYTYTIIPKNFVANTSEIERK